MTLLAYLGDEPATVEGHPWSPGEARWVNPLDATRLLALRIGDGPSPPPMFRQDGGEPPESEAPTRRPWDRAMLNLPGHRGGGAPWR